MIYRTFDPSEVNRLINLPEVRTDLGGQGQLDAAALVTDRRNICLMSQGGGAIFAWRGPGVYEGHSFFRVRGREAIALGKAILSKMDGVHVWGLTPQRLRHVRWFNRQIGFVSLGMMDTPEGPCELFEKR